MLCLNDNQTKILVNDRYRVYRCYPSTNIPAVDIVSELARVIDDSSVTRVNDNRCQVWQCTKRALCRPSFSPAARLDIKFKRCRKGLLIRVVHGVNTCSCWWTTSVMFCGQETARHLTMFQSGNIHCMHSHFWVDNVSYQRLWRGTGHSYVVHKVYWRGARISLTMYPQHCC